MIRVALTPQSASLIERVAVGPVRGDYALRVLGDECLKQPTRPVKHLEDLDVAAIDAMRGVMGELRGMGVAAPQVGCDLRMCLARLSIHNGHSCAELFVNPTIVEHAPTRVLCVNEGCLSAPIDKTAKESFRTNTYRYPWVVVDYTVFDDEGRAERRRMRCVGVDAQIMQHECDHLDGHCLFDNLPRNQRRAAERGAEKYRAARLLAVR